MVLVTLVTGQVTCARPGPLVSSPRVLSPRLGLFHVLTYENSLEGPHSAPFVDECPQDRGKAQGRERQDGKDFQGQ